MENKKSTGKTVLIALLLIVTIASLVLATYAWAKYTTTLDDATATAEVAKWSVKAGENGATFSKTYTHVVADQMAPGTSGTMTAGIDVTGTEVDVKYTISILSVTNKPTNLKFYSDAAFANEVDVTAIPAEGVVVGEEKTLVVGSTTDTATIYWNWPYETAGGDAADTADGEAEKDMVVTYRIDAWQVQPE